MTIFERVKRAGIPHDSHSSDLYLPVNDQTRLLVREYEHRDSVSTFVNNIDGKLWFDIPFAYTPWWDNAARIASGGRLQSIGG